MSAPKLYECHKHGVQIGDRCPECTVHAFIPPMVSAPIPEDLKGAYEVAKEGRYSSCIMTIELIERIAKVEEALRESEKQHEYDLRRLGSIEEKAHLQTIDERDAAEESLSQAYFLVKGESPQWSNLFGHEQALEEIEDAQKCLKAEINSQKDTINDYVAELASLREELIRMTDSRDNWKKEAELLRKGTDYDSALKVWSDEFRLLHEERDQLNARLAELGKPVTLEEWQKAFNSTTGHFREVASYIIECRVKGQPKASQPEEPINTDVKDGKCPR